MSIGPLMKTRPTRDPEEQVRLAKAAYVAGEIEVPEMERRMELALFHGLAVVAPDVPMFDRPAGAPRGPRPRGAPPAPSAFRAEVAARVRARMTPSYVVGGPDEPTSPPDFAYEPLPLDRILEGG